MLYDLKFLETGEPWPPKSERPRLDNYAAYRALFNGDHLKEYSEQFKRIQRVVGCYEDVQIFPIVLNYQRLISLKTADLIFSEPPQITVATDPEQKQLDDIMKMTGIVTTAYKSVIDVSRFGDSVLTKAVQDNMPVILSNTPEFWFPVVDRTNINNRLYDVQAWVYPTDDTGRSFCLHVTTYSYADRTVEEIDYQLIGQAGTRNDPAFAIGGEIDNSRITLSTEDGKSILVTTHNVSTADSIFGISDYDIIDSVMSEILVRISQVSKILDKHSSPTMSGPATALGYDENGLPYFRAGDYLPRASKDEPDLAHHVWDASLQANFDQIKELMHHLYTLSEMGSAFLGDFSANVGSIPSGTALRRLMMSPLTKAARIRNSYDSALKQILSACLADKGTTIAPQDISIKWKDGLPDDPAESATIMSTRTAGKATISQWSAIQQLDDKSEEDTQAEFDMIRQDEDAYTGGAGSALDDSGGVDE